MTRNLSERTTSQPWSAYLQASFMAESARMKTHQVLRTVLRNTFEHQKRIHDAVLLEAAAHLARTAIAGVFEHRDSPGLQFMDAYDWLGGTSAKEYAKEHLETCAAQSRVPMAIEVNICRVVHAARDILGEIYS